MSASTVPTQPGPAQRLRAGKPTESAAKPAQGQATGPGVDNRRWVALGVLCLSLVVIVMDNTILNVALPTLSRDLGATNSQLQWIIDSYTIVFAGLLLTFGALGDKFGRKGALSAGLGLFALGSVFSALSNSPTQLISARAFTGIGGALIMPATLSILTNIFPDAKERAKAIGIWAACSGVGVVIGPVAGGFLLEHFHWGSVFWINIPMLGVASVLVKRLVPKSRDEHAPKLDLGGALLSIGALSTLLWAIIEAPEKGWTSSTVLGAFALAAVLVTAFIRYELHHDEPMLDVRFFQNRRFSAANGAVTLTFFGMFGSLFLLTQWLQFVKGYSTLAAGVRVIPFAAGMAIGAPISAKLVERIGTKIVVTVGLSLVGVGLLTMTAISMTTPYTQVMGSMLLMAFGMGMTMAPATESVMGSLPPEKAGVGSAVNDTTRELGGAFGVAIIGSLVSSAYRGNLGSAAAALPPQAAEAVQKSLGAALQVSARVGGANGQALANAAKEGFTNALSRGFTVGAISAFLGAAAAFFFLPAFAEPAAGSPEADRADSVGHDPMQHGHGPVGETAGDVVLV